MSWPAVIGTHPRSKPRGIGEVEQHLLGRWAGLRLAVEAAKARGRMYLAAPLLDPTGDPYYVIREMVDLLDDADAPQAGATRPYRGRPPREERRHG